MFRVIAAVLAVGILAACDNGPTGPTTDGGEVTLEIFEHKEYTSKWTSEGYNFATCEKFLITPRNGVFFKLDIGSFPAHYPNDVMICTSGGRIYMGGEPMSSFYLDSGKWADFELVTLDGKARYKITVKCKCLGYDEKRNGTLYEISMYYKLLDT